MRTYKDGVFVRDPDLADFIKSGPATAAGIQLQRAFEASNSKEPRDDRELCCAGW